MNYELSVIVPVYNEKDTVNIIIDRLLAVPKLGTGLVQYIIVDDGSTDGTIDILKKNAYQKDSRFIFIFNKENCGKGSAIRSGLEFAAGKYSIIQDADLEYDPNDIIKIWEKAEERNLTVVYGSRNLDKKNNRGKPFFYFGGKLVTWLANLLYCQKLTDEPTCYKLFRTDFIKSLPLTCRRFEFCPEVTVLAAKQKILIPEISIRYFPRDKISGKKINWRDGLEAIWTLFRLRFDFGNKYFLAFLIFLFAFSLYFLTWNKLFVGYEEETAKAAQALFNFQYHVKRAGLGAVILYLPFMLLVKIMRLNVDFSYFSLVPVFWTAFSCGIVYLIIEKLIAKRYLAIAGSILIAIGTIMWPYANAGMEYQAMFWILSLSLSLLYWEKNVDNPWLVGIFFAFLAIAKSYGIIFILPVVLFMFVVLKTNDKLSYLMDIKFLSKLFLPFTVLYLLTLVLYYSVYGSVFGVYSLSNEFQIWSWWEGFYGVLFSFGKSIFIYSPLLIIAVAFWPSFYKKYKPISMFILSSFVLLVMVTVPFSYWSDETWGVRKFVAIMPLLHLPALLFFENIKNRGKIVKFSAVVLVLISIYIQILGASYDYYRHLAFLRSNNLDSLQDIRYIPQLSQIYVHNSLLLSYIKEDYFNKDSNYKYVEMSWFRYANGMDDVIFHFIDSDLRGFNKPRIFWVDSRSLPNLLAVFSGLFILFFTTILLLINYLNDRLRRKISSKIDLNN